MKINIKIVCNIVLAGLFSVLMGCAATQTILEHRKLETSTRLSKTIFLDPVVPSEKTIYVVIKNTSDENVEIFTPLTERLVSQGYRVVKSPIKAHYLLQANILKVGKMSQAASHAALGAGYGSTLIDAGVGVGIGALTSGNRTAMLGGGLAGGLIGIVSDSLVKAVNYTMITDVQISERLGMGVKVQEEYNAELKNGTAGITKQISNKETNYQRYRTRIVSNADKMNLQFKDARPALEQGLVKVLSGIF